jgi:hypothetical protein
VRPVGPEGQNIVASTRRQQASARNDFINFLNVAW